MNSHSIEKADWIWCDEKIEELNQYGLFRRWLDLPAARGRVKIHACADLRFWLYVNGQRVGFGPGRYNEKRPQFDTFDVTELVNKGRNLIAFKVHGCGPVPVYVSATPSRSALIAAVEWQGGSDVTGAGWRCIRETAYASDTPRFSAHQSFIENFDARRAQDGWETAAFDDSSWRNAFVIPRSRLAPWKQLVPRPVPLLTLVRRYPVRVIEHGLSIPDGKFDPGDMKTVGEMMETARREPGDVLDMRAETMFPLALRPPADGSAAAYAVLDFGENAAGYLALRAKGGPGAIVDFGYGEAIMNGRVNCFQQGVRYHDRVIMNGRVLSHQLMMPKCFRYLLVEVRSGAVEFECLSQDVSSLPVVWKGKFCCPDSPELERTWQIGAYTVQLCMEDIFMDTPRRERTGWLGDMVPEAMVAYYAFGETSLARHSLDLFMSSQTPEGYVSGRYPSSSPVNMPSWSACYPMAVADYVRYSGDTEFPRAVWGGIRRLTDWFERQRTHDDLLVVSPSKQSDKVKHRGYILVDWAPMMRDGAVTAMNMFYCRYLEETAWLADLLNKADEAKDLRMLAQRTKKAIQNLLFEERRGVFVNCRDERGLSAQAGAQENLLALLWDLATPKQSASIIARLIPDDSPLPLYHNLDAKNWAAMGSGEITWPGDTLVPIGTPFFEYFALGALFEIGRAEAALNNIRAHYGEILAKGATTIWEEWGGATSQSHGWGAAPTCHAGRYILGVEPLEPGFKTFSVLPCTAGLGRAAGRVPSPLGTIGVEWEKSADGVVLRVAIPEGASAVAGLPMDGSEGRLICDGAPCRDAEIITLRRGRYLSRRLKPGKHTLAQA